MHFFFSQEGKTMIKKTVKVSLNNPFKKSPTPLLALVKGRDVQASQLATVRSESQRAAEQAVQAEAVAEAQLYGYPIFNPRFKFKKDKKQVC